MDTERDRPRWRVTGSFRVLPTVQVGFEYNPVVGELGPIATAFLLTETDRRPALYLGTSSDRIGSPEGTQGYYLTTAKYIPLLHASPYVSLHYSEWEEGLNVPFGANIELGAGFALQPMHDGRRTHLLGSYTRERMSVTLLWAWLERVGAAIAVGF